MRRLWIGTMSTNSAFWMYQIAVGWLALELTDSPFFVGLAAFFIGIPQLVLALPAGVVVDRFPRRNVLFTAQLGVMTIAAVFSFMLFADVINRFWILALSLGYGASMSFIFPTRQAIVPHLVQSQDLSNAVALNAAGTNVTRILGPSLAGVSIATVGLSATFAIAAALQVIALLSTSGLPKVEPEPRVGGPRGLISRLTEGPVYVARDPLLMSLVLLAAIVTIFIMPYLTLMPVFARDVLGVGSEGLGLLMACAGVGSVIGALGVASFRTLVAQRWVQVFTCGGFATAVLVFALTPWVIPAGIVLVSTGILSAAFLAINNTVMVTEAPDEMRGRVLSSLQLTWGLLPLGQLLIGSIADRIGAPAATAIACLMALALVTMVAWRVPQLRPGGIFR